MQIWQAVRDYLLAQSSWTTLVTGGTFPERADQDNPLPYVFGHISLRDSDLRLEGPTVLIDASFDFVCVSQTYDEAFEIAELLRTLMSYFAGVMGGTSGLHVTAVVWEETEGGYSPGESAELGVFGAVVRFTVSYLPQ